MTDDDLPTAHEIANAARLLPTIAAINEAMARLRALPPCSWCHATGFNEHASPCQMCGGTGRET